MKKRFLLSFIFFLSAYISGLPARFELKIFPSNSTIKLNGKIIEPHKTNNGWKIFNIETGKHSLEIKSPGYKSLKKKIRVDGNLKYETKLERRNSSLSLIKELKTGPAPKSVEFTRDGNYLIVALLSGKGIDVFKSSDFSYLGRFSPPEKYASKKDFVESLHLPEIGEIWVSQMYTGRIHVFDDKSFEWKTSIYTKGCWSKVIVPDPENKYIYVSNWVSKNISKINITSKTVTKIIPVNGIPRGLSFNKQGNFMYVCLFDSGNIDVVDLKKEKVTKTLKFGRGAKRHAVTDYERNILYISDMYTGHIFVMDLYKDKLIKKIWVGHNLNTIKLNSDNSRLYVSSRGKNNPESYLIKGPAFGYISSLDTKTLQLSDWTWGRNQPTGLAISPDGKTMAFTDFLDNNLEIYSIKD